MNDYYPRQLTDVCALAVNLLLADDELITLLGSPSVYQLLAPESAQFPRIVLIESDREFQGFSDDAPTMERVELEAAIYGKQNQINLLTGNLQRVLAGGGFLRSGVGEDRLYADTGVYAKSVWYQIYLNLNEQEGSHGGAYRLI